MPASPMLNAQFRPRYYFYLATFWLGFMVSTSCVATPEQEYQELFTSYQNPFPELGTSTGEDSWSRVNEFLDQPTPEKVPHSSLACEKNCSRGVRPSKGNYTFYSVFDVLFSAAQDRKPGDQFPNEYLPRIRQGWDHLVQQMDELNIKLDNLREPSKAAAFAQLIVEVRDKMVAGVAEANGSPKDPLLLESFDEFWARLLDHELSPVFRVEKPNSADKLYAWLQDHGEFIDARHSPDIDLWFPFDSRFRTFLADRMKVDTNRLFSVQVRMGDYAKVKASPKFFEGISTADDLKKEMGYVIQRLFSEKLSSNPAIAYKQFLVRLNTFHYFHLMNNGNGRVYLALLQYFSLKQGVATDLPNQPSPPLHQHR